MLDDEEISTEGESVSKSTEDELTVELPDAKEISFDKGVRVVMSNLLDFDTDHGYLTATINKGSDNETEITLLLKVVGLNQVSLDNITAEDVQ